MTVDKPPMALWVQALSARVFGFGSLSLLIPQALMGVATVGLVYDLVRRRFGRAGGFVAGLALAVTPITVAIARHNNPDALLILCCAGALWCLVRGLEDGRTRWIVLAGALVGLGFETKMAVALMVVPGIALAWLWVAPRGRGAAVRQLPAGGAALVVVGGAWPLLLALTPADQRPWVSGTSDNSILSLMLEYNGFGRLSGQAGGPAGFGGAGGVFGGEPGLWRLIDASLGAQAGWLLGFAVVGGIAILLASRLRRADPRTGWLIAVGGAFATSAVAFSTAKGIFHPYYVSFLAPWTAALVGAGAAQLSGRDRAARVLAPLALAAGVACEIAVMRATGALPGWAPWLAAGVVFAGVVLVAAGSDRMRRAALAAALALLALAPAAWGVQTLGHATNGVFPAGGPAAMAGGPGGGGPMASGGRAAAMFGGGSGSLSDALAYIEANGGGTLAVSSQSTAATAVLETGADVAALGGFSGRESEVDAAWLAEAVVERPDPLGARGAVRRNAQRRPHRLPRGDGRRRGDLRGHVGRRPLRLRRRRGRAGQRGPAGHSLRQRRREPRQHPLAAEPRSQPLGLALDRAQPVGAHVLEQLQLDRTARLLPPAAHDPSLPPHRGAAVARRVEQLRLVLPEVPVALEPAHRRGVERREERGPGLGRLGRLEVVAEQVAGPAVEVDLDGADLLERPPHRAHGRPEPPLDVGLRARAEDAQPAFDQRGHGVGLGRRGERLAQPRAHRRPTRPRDDPSAVV